MKVEQGDFDGLMDLTKDLQSTLVAEHQRTHALSQEIDHKNKENKALKEQLERDKARFEYLCFSSRWRNRESKEANEEKLVRDFSAEQKRKCKRRG